MALLLAGIFLDFIAFMFGATLASGAGVIVERGRSGEPNTGRSHCVCGRQLKWYENVPVFGWLRIGGVTKCCNTKLPVNYLISEVTVGLIFAIVAGIFLF